MDFACCMRPCRSRDTQVFLHKQYSVSQLSLGEGRARRVACVCPSGRSGIGKTRGRLINQSPTFTRKNCGKCRMSNAFGARSRFARIILIRSDTGSIPEMGMRYLRAEPHNEKTLPPKSQLKKNNGVYIPRQSGGTCFRPIHTQLSNCHRI